MHPLADHIPVSVRNSADDRFLIAFTWTDQNLRSCHLTNAADGKFCQDIDTLVRHTR